MSEPVSKKAQAVTLQTLPLELRLRIYEFVALRPTGPRLLLKEWLEKVDPAIDTSTPAPVTFGQIFPPNGNFVDDGDDDDDVNVDVDVDVDDDDDDGSEAADDTMDEDEEDEDDADDGADGNVDDDDDDDADDDLDDADDEDLDDESDGATDAANGFQYVTGPYGPVTIATAGRHTKYRHTLPIVKLNACPPPLELLLVSRQVKMEAYASIYNKMMLDIDATKGFRHLEFFIDVLGSLQTEDTTPLRHIRNATVTFVWDSQWYQAHAHEPQAEMCNQVLQFRGNLASELVCAIPNLTKLKINWHDSEDSGASLAMRNDVLKAFDEIGRNKYGEPIDVNTINHFEQQGTVHKRSRLVKAMRRELDEILSGAEIR